MTPDLLWFLGWTAILAFALFFPISKLVWVLSVRRLQRKIGRPLTEDELQGQLKRARFISVFVSAIFALLFNYNVFGIGGVK